MRSIKIATLEVLLVGARDAPQLSGMLGTMGHRIIQAEDGGAALAACGRKLPDLVVVNAELPDMHGFDLIREMRGRCDGSFPILFLSDRHTEQDLLAVLRSGGDDMLLRPVNQEIFQAKLRQIQVRVGERKRLLDDRERIRAETDTARDFIEQFTVLDKINDPLVRFFIKPAEDFSGDLIAVARSPNNCLHVLLADSAGHGLTASLAVIPITQPFYQMTAKGFDLTAILRELNRRVCEYLPLPRFVAATLLSFNPQTGVIQVWNGGLPQVLLVGQQGGEILHHFKSRQLPLGVLKPEAFDAGLEYFKWVGQPASLLLCTDGVTEIKAGDRLHLDHGGLLLGARQSTAAHLFDRVVEVIEDHLDVLPEDDVALIMVDCKLDVDHKPRNKYPRFLVENANVAPVDCGDSHHQINLWEISMLLTASQLKQLDVVPFLLNIVRQVEASGTDGRLFLVLSELFNNALDHGVLKLDSFMKDEADGMERYFSERADRLANLEQGFVAVRIERLVCTPCGCLRVTVKDSGDGFDFQTMLSADQGMNRHRYGRGLALLGEMCSQLQYHGNGSEAVALVRA